MKALDTNLLVRLIARDDPEQVGMAEDILVAGEILILPTVLLETEWVLRARYGMPRDRIATGIAALCGQDGVTIASEAAVAAAVSAYRTKGDFADLLHFALATEAGANGFVTFDRDSAPTAEGGATLQIL
ncbi:MULTISPECIES: type II toxin-antitoxin system VapC family toxin [unclassified Sphingomonas]|nr:MULTISPECIES: type II toxin-antitoxin system VapC family toxin [unclassified Sphingomonas]